MWRWLLVVLITFIGAAGLYAFYRTPASPSNTATFGGVSLRIDYATTSVERELGLGNRTDVLDDYGILFVFPSAGKYGFWMKNMLVPIDIFWLDEKGHVIGIEREVATSTYPEVFYPPAPAMYVLETVAGFARLHTIAAGTPLMLKNFPVVLE